MQKTRNIKGVRRTFAVQYPAIRQKVIVQMKTIHWNDLYVLVPLGKSLCQC